MFERNNGAYTEWTYRNLTSGKTQRGGEMLYKDQFTFLKIEGAGLKVYNEKPELMLDLLKQWMGNSLGQLNGADGS